ncbi:MAG: GNAT family protein [Ilumatobacteraceae bacterium]
MRHPSSQDHPAAPLRLYGRRVVLRPLTTSDFPAWSEVRRRNEEWLLPWEPRRHPGHADPARDRSAFAARCTARDRDRNADSSYAFGMFVGAHGERLAGEVNLNNIVRGAMQAGTIGYWIDRELAGNAYTAEAVAVVIRFAFEELHLHRLEVCIVPRNENSRRVMDKLALRCEGLAERFLEIDGVWEDHLRYAITVEEWNDRRAEVVRTWMAAPDRVDGG